LEAQLPNFLAVFLDALLLGEEPTKCSNYTALLPLLLNTSQHNAGIKIYAHDQLESRINIFQHEKCKLMRNTENKLNKNIFGLSNYLALVTFNVVLHLFLKKPLTTKQNIKYTNTLYSL
jgi:hypothetical protein